MDISLCKKGAAQRFMFPGLYVEFDCCTAIGRLSDRTGIRFLINELQIGSLRLTKCADAACEAEYIGVDVDALTS